MRTLLRLFLAVALCAGLACSSEDGSAESTGSTRGPGDASPGAVANPDQPVSSDAGTSSLCVETYSLENLGRREFAFDGTARSLAPDDDASGAEGSGVDLVTFDVHEWFKGGEGEQATVKASGFGSGAVSSVGGGWEIGDRLLVAGDDDYLWECGFTQGYDADVAAQWEAAFAG